MKSPPSATFAVLRASASGAVAERVRVASATWLCVLSGMSTVTTERVPSFGKGGRREGGTALGRQAPNRSARRRRMVAGSKSPETESSALLGRK